MGIAQQRAKQRQAENARKNQPQAKRVQGTKSQKQEASPTSEKSQARDAAGKKTGVSGLTAERFAFFSLVLRSLHPIDFASFRHGAK
jgi:hypothetical protein